MTEEQFEARMNNPENHSENNLWHSAEPWRRVDSDIYSAEDHYPIAEVCNEHGETSLREDRINAERIVACVNFCAGMTNNELAKTTAQKMAGGANA